LAAGIGDHLEAMHAWKRRRINSVYVLNVAALKQGILLSMNTFASVKTLTASNIGASTRFIRTVRSPFRDPVISSSNDVIVLVYQNTTNMAADAR
jgi:hypothetical protein